MSRKKKGEVFKLPEKYVALGAKCVGYGLWLLQTGCRPQNPPHRGPLKSIRIVFNKREEELWEETRLKYPTRAAAIRDAFAVVDEIGPLAQNVSISKEETRP